jgi:hypothetical protein
MKLFLKNIWLFSKTNDAIYFTKYCSRAAGELIAQSPYVQMNFEQSTNQPEKSQPLTFSQGSGFQKVCSKL